MVATPERPSVAERVTDAGPFTQSIGPLAVVMGAASSMRTILLVCTSVLPAASTDQYSTVLVPSADTANGAV